MFHSAAYHGGERNGPELAWSCVFVPSARSSPEKSTKPIKAMDRPTCANLSPTLEPIDGFLVATVARVGGRRTLVQTRVAQELLQVALAQSW